MSKGNTSPREIENMLEMYKYLRILDSDQYSTEKKVEAMYEAVEFMVGNLESIRDYNAAYKEIAKFLVSHDYRKMKDYFRTPEKAFLFFQEFFSREGIPIVYDDKPDGTRSIRPLESSTEKGTPELGTIREYSIKKMITKSSYKQITIQTLLIFWILLFLLSKEGIVTSILSNPENHALIGVGSVICSLIAYLIVWRD